jgi:protein-L-isoaspartate(D-aspartate) O-methyltransferase
MTLPASIEQARFNMIEQQIRPWDVLDPQVLALLSVLHREDFVPASHQALAFVDMEIPLVADAKAARQPGPRGREERRGP